MLCKKPFRQGVAAFGCGQCLPCRIKIRRERTHRAMIESLKHGDSAFVNLTYRFECFAGTHENSGSVYRKHVQDFIKRLRSSLSYKIRVFGVGEYGDTTQRPHYHLIIYGYPTCTYGRSRYSNRTKDCCASCDLIRDTWKLGHVYLGDVTKDSCAYVAGYVLKKLTSKNSQFQREALQDRNPEFAIYPNKPGLGALGVPDIVQILTRDVGANSLIAEGDVPSSLRHGGKAYPLGRYLRRKIREYYGFPEKRTKATSTSTTNTPDGWLQKAAEEMRELLEKHDYDQKKIVEEKMQKLLNLEKRNNIFTKRRRF